MYELSSLYPEFLIIIIAQYTLQKLFITHLLFKLYRPGEPSVPQATSHSRHTRYQMGPFTSAAVGTCAKIRLNTK